MLEESREVKRHSHSGTDLAPFGLAFSIDLIKIVFHQNPDQFPQPKPYRGAEGGVRQPTHIRRN